MGQLGVVEHGFLENGYKKVSVLTGQNDRKPFGFIAARRAVGIDIWTMESE